MKADLAQLVCALLCEASVSVVAAPTLPLTPDPIATGPGKFAAEEDHLAAIVRVATVVSGGNTTQADAVGNMRTVGAPTR